MQGVRGLPGSRWGAVRRMNHQTGPDADGADASAVDGTPAESASVRDGAENEAWHAAGVEEQAEADGGSGEAADDEVAAVVSESAGPEDGELADDEVAAAVSAPSRPDTGEPRVDAALTLLDRLAELPVTEHAVVFEQVHAELTAVLGQLDPESAGADD
jgi:hypothetical protein